MPWLRAVLEIICHMPAGPPGPMASGLYQLSTIGRARIRLAGPSARLRCSRNPSAAGSRSRWRAKARDRRRSACASACCCCRPDAGRRLESRAVIRSKTSSPWPLAGALGKPPTGGWDWPRAAVARSGRPARSHFGGGIGSEASRSGFTRGWQAASSSARARSGRVRRRVGFMRRSRPSRRAAPRRPAPRSSPAHVRCERGCACIPGWSMRRKGLQSRSLRQRAGQAGQARARAARATSARRWSRSALSGSHATGEAAVGLRVFVAAADQRVAGQGGQAVQRGQHLRRRALEQAAAAEAEERVAAEQVAARRGRRRG